MNTNKLKPFAQNARRILLDGVARRVQFLGFDAKGKVVEEPMSVAGGVILRGEVIDDPTLTGKWNALRSAIQRNGLENVVEEAAYTWFNRMMAIRILAKNNYDLPQLEYEAEGSHTPLILTRARRGNMTYLDRREQSRVTPLLADYTQEQKAFTILLTGYCHHHKLLNRVFGRLNDYTELLLPDNALAETGFVHLLNTTDAISDDDYRKVELIGWLYQFYISERKDEVFASFKKNKKAEAEDIPAATQIFTPNWIVKYMVQNTIGRLWLDQHPDSPLKEKMKYLVELSQNGIKEEPAIKGGLEEGFKLLDPACGSGHILVEGFYHLYDMYEEEYYMPGEAVEKIFQHNLYGLDIDLRAAQLAQFAVLLAAASKHPDILKSEVTLHIYAMPEPNRFSQQEIREFLGSDGFQHERVLTNALELMQEAKNLGSVMQFNVTDAERRFFQQRLSILQSEARSSLMAQSLYNKFLPFIQVIQVLTDRYEAIAANPPYMGQKNMNDDLKGYVYNHYSLTKSDLFAVFMDVCLNRLGKQGKMGMINQHSWMFLSSFEGLRKHLMENYWLENMIHLGPRTFEELNGEVVQSTAFVFSRVFKIATSQLGNYIQLIDYKNVKEKEIQFLTKNHLYKNVLQSNFFKLPGCQIAYWINKAVLDNFNSHTINDFVHGFQGIITGNNDTRLRFWFEINIKTSNLIDSEDKKDFKQRYWVPYLKGGTARKWYGNQELVVFWKDQGIGFTRRRGENSMYYFKKGITWTYIGSNLFTPRTYQSGCLWDVHGTSIFPLESKNFYKILGSLVSKPSTYFLNILNPTISFQLENILSTPIKLGSIESEPLIDKIVENAIVKSKYDWDSRETSWDFKQIAIFPSEYDKQFFSEYILNNYTFYSKRLTDYFYFLHSYEEEINRIFIASYGLNEVLDPTVPLREITVLQEELDFAALDEAEAELRKRRQWRLEDGKWNLYVDNTLQPISAEGELPKAAVQPPLPIKKNVVMQQLISYAVGCMMGRYSLEAPGLILANQGDNLEDYFSIIKEKQEQGERAEGMPNSITSKFVPDDDAIIPLMGSNCGFPDDVVHRIRHFIEVVWGSEALTQNINFLQSYLDMDLEKYLVTQGNFWKDHCSRYKKKPIYWLFSSKKGAFQVLVYMHRMHRFTVQKIRDNYLLRHLQWLNNQIAQMQAIASSLSRVEAKRLDYLRSAFAECEEYDLHLKNIADQQIEFDLDEGVSVNYEKFTPVVAPIK